MAIIKNPLTVMRGGNDGAMFSGISIDLDDSSLQAGKSYPLTVTLTLSDGREVPGYSDANVINWQVNNTGAIEIQYETSSTGLKIAKAFGKDDGAVTITAKIGKLTATKQISVVSSEFMRLKKSLDNGTYASAYPIGTEIDDTWTDTADEAEYKIPLIIMDYQNVTLADGTKKIGAILMRKYTMPFKVQFDAKEPKNSTTTIQNAGYNRYSQSGVHKWLNADAAKGNWWTASSSTDVAPSIATTKDGYLKGCSESLLASIKEVQIKAQTNNANDGGVVDIVKARFFLPSVEELFGNPEDFSTGISGVEVFERYWAYMKTATGLSSPSNASNNGRVFYTPSGSKSSAYWLRSAVLIGSASAWFGNSYGLLNYQGNSATTSQDVIPACVIA